MTYIAPNVTGLTDATGSSPIALSVQYIGGSAQTIPALNYEFLTNSTNGWFDALGYAWVSFTIVTNAALTAGNITFEVTDDSAATAPNTFLVQDSTSVVVARTAIVSLTASAVRHYDAPVSGRYIRVRTSTAFTGAGGTVAVTATLRQSSPVVGAVATDIIGTIPTGGNTIGLVSLGASSAANGSVFLGSAKTIDINAVAYTSTTTTSPISMVGGSGNAAAFSLTVASVVGILPTLDVVISESYGGGSYVDLYHFERIIAAGNYISPTLQLSGSLLHYTFTITGTAAPSFTITANRLDRPLAAPLYKQFFDRTMGISLNSTTASYMVQGASQVFISVNTSGGTTGCAVTIQGSQDNIQWYDLGTATTTLVSGGGGSVQGSAPSFFGKWVRARVNSAGSGQTMNYVCIKALGA